MAVLTRSRSGAGPSARVLVAMHAVALTVVALAAAGCSCSGPGMTALEGVDWKLQGSSATAVDFRVYDITARFEGGTLAGHAPVNSYTASYRLEGGSSLAISDITATLMAGTPDAMAAEEIYMTLLRAVRSWQLDGGQLELRDSQGNPLLIYTRAPKKAAAEEPANPPPASSETTTPPSSALSDTSLAYARSIGGTAHRGELLYVIVGSTYPTEAAASAALNAALPTFGDMQSYFIVQRSDNFAGLGTGQWMTLEAFRRHPDEGSLQLARRAFPEALVKRVTVRTDDPIPVYEDLVGR